MALRRALVVVLSAAIACGRLTTFAHADVPEAEDPAGVVLPVSYPPPMQSPVSASAYLPAPTTTEEPAPVPAPDGVSDKLPEADLPSEGWTVSTHWKHNGDGTISGELFTGPQFRKAGTEWLPIDTALSTLPSGAVSSPGSLVPATFGVSTAQLVTLTLPGGVVTESWTDQTKPVLPSVAGRTVTYENLATDADLELDVDPDGVKERIVLRSAQARRAWHFHLADPAGALGDVVPLGAESFKFTKPVAPDTYLVLPAPYAYELMPGRTIPPVLLGSAHQTVTKVAGGFDVTLSVDEDWLAGKSFPIVLDPTKNYRNTEIASWVTSQVSEGNKASCGGTRGGCSGYVPPASNPNAMGAASQTEVVAGVYNIDARPARSFYKFSTSQIQENSLISTANFILFQNGCFGFDPTLYECDEQNYRLQYYPLRQSHTVNSTWSQIAATAATGPVLNYKDVLAFAPGTRQAITFDIREVVKDWIVSGFYPPNPNYGMGQRLSSEPATTNIGGPSFSGPNDPIADQRPKVDITWSPPPGAPRSVTASAPSNSSVKVDWLAPTANGGPAVDGYEVMLWNAGTGETRTANVCGTCLTTTFSALPYGSYYATVTAANSVGYGPPSANSNTVVLSPAPQLLKTVTNTVAGTGGYYGRGQEIEYTLKVSNPASTTMVVDTVTDTIPAGLLASSPSGIKVGGVACTNCSVSGTTLTVGSFSIPGNGSVDVVYKAIAVGTDRVCSVVTNSARAANAYGASTSSASVTVCDTALGMEDWWSYAADGVAAESTASVNVANGNLVVQANDSTPMQAHGRLAYAVRRTYNSQDTGVLSLPGSIGGGWQLNLGEVDDLAGVGLTATGLSVPSATTVANPLGVTLVDRDGTRHLFRFRSLAAPISLSALPYSVLGSLTPRVLDTTKYANVCVDATYSAPPGVHLSLWRYVGVSSSGCGGVSSGVVLGFAAMRPDRLRTEYSWNGRLVSMVDPSGVEMRYQYESLPLAGANLGRLTAVYESNLRPVSGGSTCAVALVATCRKISIAYATNQVTVTDPAGRATKYVLDGATPVSHLVTVINPTDTTTAPDRVSYTYDGFGANCDGSTTTATGQLCAVTDARGHTTTFTYGASVLGPKRVTAVTDRRGTTTTLAYSATTPEYVTADTGTHRTRYLGIDSYGRVSQTDEGSTNDMYLRSTKRTWDTAGCRQPTAAVDHNVCRVTRSSFTAGTPDEVTDYVYSPEGNLLATRRANTGGTPATLDMTYGYVSQYAKSDNYPSVVHDTVGANGVVTSGARPDPATPNLVYVVSDRVAMVPPRGNAAGSAYLNYATTYSVANSSAAAPNTTATGTYCTDRNNGVLCSKTEPHTGTTRVTTSYGYDSYGQRTSMQTPKPNSALSWRYAGKLVYNYYSDTDRDLSGTVSSGGWLRSVSDPMSDTYYSWATVEHFVGYGYDAAGNVARTWDRNRTSGSAATFTPSGGGYVESLRGSLATPWRYVTETSDAKGNRTRTTVDRHGNALRATPPRGVAANSTTYDVVATYDAHGNPLTTKTPMAAQPTSYTYDAFDNRASRTDPLGHVTVSTYDAVNRVTETAFTRGPFPADAAKRPPGCRPTATTASDAPFPANKLVCSTKQSFDGVDNVLSKTDADGQVTTVRYDAVHRVLQTDVPRHDGLLNTLRTDSVYDADGNAIRTCPPRSFAEGGATTCAAGDPYGTHSTYDEAGRKKTVTTYRTAGGAANTTTFGYDPAGNLTTTTDPRGTTTTSQYDWNNRLMSQSVPRDANVSNVTYFEYDEVGNLTSVTRPGAVEVGTGADGDLTIDGNVYNSTNPYVLQPGKNFRNLTLVNGAYAKPGGTGRLEVKATGTISICAGCVIDANGAGLPGGAGGTSLTAAAPSGNGAGPGGGGSPGAANGGGGGGAGHRYGGSAGVSVTAGGAAGAGGGAYGTPDLNAGNDTDLGSGGGGGGAGGTAPGGAGGAGGGFIRLVANKIVNDGYLTARGVAGASVTVGVGGTAGGSGGGGSGGGIWLTAPTLVAGGLDVAGGQGGDGPSPGGWGADGYVRLDTDTPGYEGARTLGRITAYSYDANNRVIDTVAGSSSRFASAAGVADAQGGRNVRTRVAYDSEGRVVAQFDPRAFAASTSTPDPRYMTRSEYDRDGRLVATYTPRWEAAAAPDPGLSTTQQSQCPTGRNPEVVAGVPSYTNTGVCMVRYTYDDAGNRTKVTMPTSNGSDNRYVLTTYTDDGKALSVESPSPATAGGRQLAAQYEYDGSGRLVRTTNALGHQAVTTYTADGLVATKSGETSSSASVNHFVEYRYDANGQPTEMRTWLNHAPVDPQPATPDVRVSTTTYWTDGLRKDVYGTGLSATDTSRDKTSYAYDAAGNPTSTVSPSANAGDANNTAGTPVVSTYSADSLLLARTSPFAPDGSLLRRTTFGYDAAGRKVSEASAMVNAQGAVVESSAATRFAYLDNDRLASQTGRNGESVAYTYDPAGNTLTTVNTPTSGAATTTTATYYLDGRVRTVGERGRTVQYAYDASGARVARADVVDATGAKLVTTNAYGDAGQLASHTSDVVGGATQSWSYDIAGRLATISVPNGASISRVYNRDGNVASQTLTGTTGVLSRWDYTYDGIGRITAANQGTSTTPSLDCTPTASSLPTGLHCFSYNAAGRVSQFKDRGGDRALTWDHDGNRLSYGTATAPATFTYNADDSIRTSKAGPTAPTRNSSYSPTGALLGDECTANTYDGFDRQLTATVKTATGCGTPVVTTYSYDGLDRQATRTESGAGATTPGTTALHYDGLTSALAHEARPDGSGIDYALGPDGGATAVRRTGSSPVTQYLTDDARGSVSTTMSSSNGSAAACSVRYDPFGNAMDAIGPANPCSSGFTPSSVLYRGARRDSATGTYQMGARSYDPSRASFNTADNVRTGAPNGPGSVGNDPLTRNLYSYVNGDPLNLVDPDGHRPACDDPGDECRALLRWFQRMVSGKGQGPIDDGPLPPAEGNSVDHDLAVAQTAMMIRTRLPRGAQMCAALPGMNHSIGILRDCRMRSQNPKYANNKNYGPRPDIVVLHNDVYYVWEVKPYTEYGRRTAERDAGRFVKAFQLRGVKAQVGQWVPTTHVRLGKSTLFTASPPKVFSGARYYQRVTDDDLRRYREGLVRKTPMPGEVRESLPESPLMTFSEPGVEAHASATPSPSPRWQPDGPLPLDFGPAWWQTPLGGMLIVVGIVVVIGIGAAVFIGASAAVAAFGAATTAAMGSAAGATVTQLALQAADDFALAA